MADALPPVAIFSFLDYRQYLEAYYRARKAADKKFSHRFIGKEGRFDPGLFSKILQGKRDISPSMVFRLTTLLKLDRKETEYFQCLVLYNQARLHSERNHHYEKLIALRGAHAKPVEQHQHRFYGKWYYSALRALLDFLATDGSDCDRLARQLVPPIKSSEAREGLDLLEKLGLAVRDADGRYRVRDSLITTGYGNAALNANNFVLESLELAKGAIDRFPATERNLSTVTFSIPKARYPHYEARIRAFRRELMAEIEKEKGVDIVYQLNLQLFPLSQPREGVDD
jgi:uncharacterized protein (TIGR02147 family)